MEPGFRIKIVWRCFNSVIDFAIFRECEPWISLFHYDFLNKNLVSNDYYSNSEEEKPSISKRKSLNVLLFIDLVPIKFSKCHFGEPRPNELIWIIDCQLILCKFFLHWKKTQLIRMNDLHVVWFRVFECTQHQLHIDWFNKHYYKYDSTESFNSIWPCLSRRWCDRTGFLTHDIYVWSLRHKILSCLERTIFVAYGTEREKTHSPICLWVTSHSFAQRSK